MDQIKQTIAGNVQQALMMRNWTPDNHMRNNLGVESVEVSRVDDLTTQLRVRTQRSGIRYMTVKVTEHI